MRKDKREQRENDIARVAYDLLEQRGYGGVSMLAIAKAAKASNETLYRWYGDKAGLFLALVERNAQEAHDVLANTSVNADFATTMHRFGAVLLGIVTGPRAVALNRAAAGDPSDQLGAAIAKGGREAVLPALVAHFERARTRGDIATDNLQEAVADYVSLLVGDLQIRRAIGALAELDDATRQQRAERAFTKFIVLYGVDQPRA